jgi:hypothetical protein
MPDAPAPMTQRSGVETLAKPDLYRRIGRTVPLLAARRAKGQQPRHRKSWQAPEFRRIRLRHRVRGQIPRSVDLTGPFLYSPGPISAARRIGVCWPFAAWQRSSASDDLEDRARRGVKL